MATDLTRSQFKLAYGEVRKEARKYRTPPLFGFDSTIAVAALQTLRRRQCQRSTTAVSRCNSPSATRFWLSCARKRVSA